MTTIAILPGRFSRRREKIFGQGRCQPLDGNAKARMIGLCPRLVGQA